MFLKKKIIVEKFRSGVSGNKKYLRKSYISSYYQNIDYKNNVSTIVFQDMEFLELILVQMKLYYSLIERIIEKNWRNFDSCTGYKL